MDVEYFQYIVDDDEGEVGVGAGPAVNAAGFDPEDAAAALFNCKLSDSFSNSSWSTNETLHSSFGNNSSVFEALDFSSFTDTSSDTRSSVGVQFDVDNGFRSPSPALPPTPLPLQVATNCVPISITTADPMASVRLDHFYTSRVAPLNSSPTTQFLPPSFLRVDGPDCSVRRYSSRGRPAKTAMEKFIQLCIRGIPGVDRVHWEAELENNNLKYICKLCSRQFGLAYSLKQHIRFVHMKVRPFPCESCDKKFRSMYDLRRHSTLHTRERFVCVGCGTAYCSKQRVIAHIRKQCPAALATSVTKENEHDQYAIDRSLSPLAPSSSSPSSLSSSAPLQPQIPDLWP